MHSHYAGGDRRAVCTKKGTYRCGLYVQCPWTWEGETITLSDDSNFIPRNYIDYQPVEVVYLMNYVCRASYLRKTKRPFCRHIQDHVYYVESGMLSVPTGRHASLKHRYDMKSTDS